MKPHWNWNHPWIALLAGVIALVAFGCVHVAYEPPLPMPVRPAIKFFLCDIDKVCMTQLEADLLSKWVEKLDEFEAGRQRVLSGQEIPKK